MDKALKNIPSIYLYIYDYLFNLLKYKRGQSGKWLTLVIFANIVNLWFKINKKNNKSKLNIIDKGMLCLFVYNLFKYLMMIVRRNFNTVTFKDLL